MKIASRSQKISQVAHPWRIWTGIDSHTWTRASSQKAAMPQPARGSGRLDRKRGLGAERGLCFCVCRLWVQLFTRMNTPGRSGDRQVAILTSCLVGRCWGEVPQRSDFCLSHFTPVISAKVITLGPAESLFKGLFKI